MATTTRLSRAKVWRLEQTVFMVKISVRVVTIAESMKERMVFLVCKKDRM